MLALFATALAIFGGAAACGNLTRPKAQTENSTDTLTVYALNGTPVSAPVGIWLFGRTSSVISSNFDFDLAFDIDGQGNTTLYTVRYIAGGLSGAHSVALQRYTGGYDALTKAPSTGYITDSLFTTKVGDVFAAPVADGFVVAKVREIRAAAPTGDFAQAETQLKASLQQSIASDLMDQLTRGLSTRYPVEVNNKVVNDMVAQAR